MKNDESDAADLLRMGRLPEAWIAPQATRELRPARSGHDGEGQIRSEHGDYPDHEGQTLTQIVRRGRGNSIRVRRATIIMASSSGTPVAAIARLDR